MKLTPFDCRRLDLESDRVPLSPRERDAADFIAGCIRRNVVSGPVGLFIHEVCRARGVDQHRVARHLGMRTKRK